MEEKLMLKNSGRKKLTSAMKKEVTDLMEKTLDFADVACSKDNFKQLRSKILRVCNNCMRNLEKEFDSYDIRYNKIIEEVIEFRNKG